MAEYTVGIRQQINIPNILTLSRVFPLPVLVSGTGFAAWYYDWSELYWLASSLVLVAGVTDFFDGYLARLKNQVTPLGVEFDPIADKVFMWASLLPGAFLSGNIWMAALWPLMCCYDADNLSRRWPRIRIALCNQPVGKNELPATWVSKSKTAILFFLLSAAYLPPKTMSPAMLSFLVWVSAAAVAYSWFNNRKGWLRDKFGL